MSGMLQFLTVNNPSKNIVFRFILQCSGSIIAYSLVMSRQNRYRIYIVFGILLPKIYDFDHELSRSYQQLCCHQKTFSLLMNGILFLKLVLTFCEKKNPRICKNFEITRTIFLNCERSEQFLKQWYFVTKIVLTYCEKKMFQ